VKYAGSVVRGMPVGDIENDYMKTISSLNSLKNWVIEASAEDAILIDFEIET